ncbi:uncharacterized protein NPIL_131971 [Nephila pilipes]|uniref:Neurogenic mastermind-like N-terminal domain-containing protein n=1 Tax=Nephila pilipes TaxID=299642 RepID=A0A8X6TY65_NEPPI|nr:uncharacterized protein NPIL_131971 [Nephila pilipes]
MLDLFCKLLRFEQAASSLYESQRQDTVLLKQRFLESKAKKAKSKSDHHRTYKESVSDGSKSQLHSKPVKRSADDAIPTSTTETTCNEDSEKASKMPRLDAVPDKPPVPDLLPTQQANQQNIMSAFSVQIVQQFSQSPLHQPSQSIQTTVTVQTGPKPQTPQSVAPNQKPAEAPPTSQEDILQSAAPLMGTIVPNVECKQEQDAGDADLCQFKNNSQASNNSGGSVGDRLSDTFPSLEFTDESGENVIHPDILNDLIEDVIINSGDIMNDFNFEDSVGSLKDQEDTPKDIIDLVKGTSPNQLRSFQTDNMSFVNTATNTLPSNGLFRNIPASSSESPISTLSSPATTTSSAFFNNASQRLPSFANSAVPPLPNGLGLDFKLTEPSPAALTLKQMAEQHQNMQQKQQQQQQQHLVNSSLTNRPQPFNQSTFSTHLNSLRPANFLNSSNPAIQNNNQKMLNSGTNLFNTFDQCINNFPGDENTANFPASCESLSPNTMFSPDVRNRTSNAMTDLQMKMTNHPMEQQNPPAYGTTRPLSHFADNASVRLPNLVNNQQQQQQRPVGRQFQNNSAMPLQINQVQQMQPRQHNSQQLQQNPHDMKQQPQQHSVMQQHLNVYGNYPSQQQVGNPSFHVSMSQSLNFTSQFNTNPALSRPPPEYKPTTHHRNVMSDNMHLVDQLNAPSAIFSQPTKNKYSKQQQRPPNVTITPDGSAISSSHDWRNNMMNNNQQQQNQFRSSSFGAQENYNLNTNGPVTANVPLSPIYNQYRIPNNQNLPNRMVRPNRMPQGPMIVQQRQRIVISQRPPRNPTMTSTELHSTLPLNNNPITPNTVIGPMYSEPQEIERQDGSHLNLDFLDSIGSSASDLLNFVPVMQDPNFPTFEEIEILSK